TSTDRAIGDLPAVVSNRRSSGKDRLERLASLAVENEAARSRGDPRLGLGAQQTVKSSDGWSQRLSAASARSARGPIASRRRLGLIGRARISPPERLCLRQAQPRGPGA